MTSPCNHIYCKACLEESMAISQTCPQCRQGIASKAPLQVVSGISKKMKEVLKSILPINKVVEQL